MREGSNAVHCTHQGKGDAILFIHGMPTNRKLWDGVIQQLSDHHRCFAVDLPGMGETPFTPYGPDYLDRMARQIELLRIRHGVQKWHVVGHDAGSAIAVQYSGRFSRHVACLALLSPAIFPELKPFYLLNALRKPLLGEMLAPLVHFVFWRIAMRRAIAGESRGTLLRAFYQPFSGLTGAWQLMRLVRWGRPEDMLGEIPGTLGALPMPTLLFHGMRDVLPAAFAERAASLIPNSSLLTLDAGHFIPLDRPTEVAACLQSFFAVNRATMDLPVRARKLRKRSAPARTMVAEPLSLEVHRSIVGVS
jgi:pimeloyl-ACP methyl ester carboxylesterase